MVGMKLLLFGALASTLARAEDLLSCGDARYSPTKYTCYEGNFLCPKVNGDPTLKCGAACYLPGMYKCVDNQLQLLPRREGAFTLIASNPNAPFHNYKIEACGRRFTITQGGPCTYCPQSVPRAACPAGTSTIMTSGSLSVMVPGGQQLYVEANGALGFTQAHSLSRPPGAIMGGGPAYEGGLFFGPSHSPWFACPVKDSGGNQIWQLFASLPGVTLDPACVGLNARVQNASGLGAWQYT